MGALIILMVIRETGSEMSKGGGGGGGGVWTVGKCYLTRSISQTNARIATRNERIGNIS